MSSTDGRNYSLHLIEAPDMPNAPKNFFHQSGLHDVTLSNGGWKVTQKTTDPWKGLWIYGTVFAGVHIEIDGTDQVAVKGLAESI